MIIKHGKHEIELYDSVHDLPILRFQRFNKYQMQSVEIGNSFEDYLNRSNKALQFFKKDMKKEGILELENRNQTVFNAYNEFTPKGKSFAVLVKRIDSVYYSKSFTPNDLDRCIEHLNEIGFSMFDVSKNTTEVKKKIELELQVYFPSYFKKNNNKEQSVLRYKRANKVLELISQKQLDEENIELFTLEKQILEMDKPNIWNVHVPGNMERQLEVDFQKFGIGVAEHTKQKLDEMTTFSFYASVEHIKDKTTKNN